MTFVLKTRAITGELVPLNGEHIEYDTIERADDAAGHAIERGSGRVFIVDFASDLVHGGSSHGSVRGA